MEVRKPAFSAEESRNNFKAQLAERVELATASKDNLTEEDLADEPFPSDGEISALAAKLTPKEILANLKLLKELLDDEEEDIAPEDRKSLKIVYDETLAYLKENKTSLNADEVEEFYNKSHGADGRFTSSGGGGGRASKTSKETKAPGNIHKRLSSLTPHGFKETWYKRGSSNQNEYNHGLYNFNYRPKNIKEAKHKIRKARSSRLRWAAASVLTAPTAPIPGLKKVFKAVRKVSAIKRDQHLTAKRQYRALLSKSM